MGSERPSASASWEFGNPTSDTLFSSPAESAAPAEPVKTPRPAPTVPPVVRPPAQPQSRPTADPDIPAAVSELRTDPETTFPAVGPQLVQPPAPSSAPPAHAPPSFTPPPAGQATPYASPWPPPASDRQVPWWERLVSAEGGRSAPPRWPFGKAGGFPAADRAVRPPRPPSGSATALAWVWLVIGILLALPLTVYGVLNVAADRTVVSATILQKSDNGTSCGMTLAYELNGHARETDYTHGWDCWELPDVGSEIEILAPDREFFTVYAADNEVSDRVAAIFLPIVVWVIVLLFFVVPAWIYLRSVRRRRARATEGQALVIG